MTTDPGTTVPGAEPSVSIIDTAWGTVVRTRDVVGLAAAVKLRRIVLRRLDVVVLDLWATVIAESTVVAAVADLAAGLQALGKVLRIVRSARTPDALVAAADAPIHASLAEALGLRPSPPDQRSEDPRPDRPVVAPRRPTVTAGWVRPGPPPPGGIRSGPIPHPSRCPTPVARTT
ncbi:MAG TPA: hypothetical protein VK894_01435, partial [Jiangellales bacterium]|nr:hypothetical protein [Jiangellales bacterium]